MPTRWSRITPQLALAPAVAVTAFAFVGSVGWTIMLSFTSSRRFPTYEFSGISQYARLFRDSAWALSLQNMVILGIGSLLSILIGFVLAVLVDKEVLGRSLFRTVFLYPLAVSLIVTGIVWKWLFNPSLGLQHAAESIGLTGLNLDWLSSKETVMYGIIIASIWQSTGFYMALMLSGLKNINSEIWQAARIDGIPMWRLYVEVIIPMMKLTFITSILLLSIGVVKAYEVIVAMTNGGPGGGSFVPAFFAIYSYWQRQNLGYASAAATSLLIITCLLFLPFVLLRRRSAS